MHGGPAVLDALTVDLYFTGYADHIGAAGGLAVHLPSRADPRSTMDRMDGLVLTGGTDVDPARYGAAVPMLGPASGPSARATTPPLDPDRDAVELALLDVALERGLPVLAICRGLQLVNVGRGGTLHAHLADHHPASGRHDVLVEPGSVLGGLYGATASVNSVHHQGVDRLGADLVVTARARDGVVEGIELPGAQLLGVQWHPEQMAGPQPVFGWLVDAAR
jgi:putative glutamine amidotransferase